MQSVPFVYTLGVVWDTDTASSASVKEFLDSISEYLDLHLIEKNLMNRSEQVKPGEPVNFKLKGMMCYYGAHYAAYCQGLSDGTRRATMYIVN